MLRIEIVEILVCRINDPTYAENASEVEVSSRYGSRYKSLFAGFFPLKDINTNH